MSIKVMQTITKKKVGNNMTDWRPFTCQNRVKNAKKVETKKTEIYGNKLAVSTKRSKITTYISKELKCRQEEEPLVNEHINVAKSEPLHLKNNVVK